MSTNDEYTSAELQLVASAHWHLAANAPDVEVGVLTSTGFEPAAFTMDPRISHELLFKMGLHHDGHNQVTVNKYGALVVGSENIQRLKELGVALELNGYNSTQIMRKRLEQGQETSKGST